MNVWTDCKCHSTGLVSCHKMNDNNYNFLKIKIMSCTASTAANVQYTIKPSAAYSLYWVTQTDKYEIFTVLYLFHSPLPHIYWNGNLLSQNYKPKKATLMLAKPQTWETKLNSWFKTCYLLSKLNYRLRFVFGWHTVSYRSWQIWKSYWNKWKTTIIYNESGHRQVQTEKQFFYFL